MTLNIGLEKPSRPGDEKMKNKSSVLLKHVRGMKERELNQ